METVESGDFRESGEGIQDGAWRTGGGNGYNWSSHHSRKITASKVKERNLLSRITWIVTSLSYFLRPTEDLKI